MMFEFSSVFLILSVNIEFFCLKEIVSFFRISEIIENF